jgi:hypothetical protein
MITPAERGAIGEETSPPQRIDFSKRSLEAVKRIRGNMRWMAKKVAKIDETKTPRTFSWAHGRMLRLASELEVIAKEIDTAITEVFLGYPLERGGGSPAAGDQPLHAGHPTGENDFEFVCKTASRARGKLKALDGTLTVLALQILNCHQFNSGGARMELEKRAFRARSGLEELGLLLESFEKRLDDFTSRLKVEALLLNKNG